MLDANTPKEFHAVQKTLGLRHERAANARQSAANTRNANEFAALTRKTRKDFMRPHATRTVRNFQRSNECSREDTNKTRLTKVEGAEDHSQRIWTCGVTHERISSRPFWHQTHTRTSKHCTQAKGQAVECSLRPCAHAPKSKLKTRVSTNSAPQFSGPWATGL